MEEKKKKKPYPGKPEIYFESFATSTGIARDCEVKANLTLEESCSADYYRENVFTYAVASCDYKQSNGSPVLDGLCYTTHSDDFNVFNS